MPDPTDSGVPAGTGSAEPVSRTGILLRLGFFFFLEILGVQIFGVVLHETFGYLTAAALGTFLAAAVANAIVIRIYERGRMNTIGMGWSSASRRHLGLGVAGGVVAALAVLFMPLLAGVSHLVQSSDPAQQFSLPRLIFVSVILLFGAVGEELLFRGYGFQVLLARLGPWATILPFGVAFGAAHVGNLNVSWIGLVNTTAWGVLFGYAFFRSGDLWFPIGLHFGWNWVLPLFGANLSGLTIELSGFEIESKAGPLWTGGAYGPEASLLTSVVVVALGWWVHRVRLERQPVLLLEARNQAA
jgi:uncharacterized protein